MSTLAQTVAATGDVIEAWDAWVAKAPRQVESWSLADMLEASIIHDGYLSAMRDHVVNALADAAGNVSVKGISNGTPTELARLVGMNDDTMARRLVGMDHELSAGYAHSDRVTRRSGPIDMSAGEYLACCKALHASTNPWVEGADDRAEPAVGELRISDLEVAAADHVVRCVVRRAYDGELPAPTVQALAEQVHVIPQSRLQRKLRWQHQPADLSVPYSPTTEDAVTGRRRLIGWEYLYLCEVLGCSTNPYEETERDVTHGHILHV